MARELADAFVGSMTAIKAAWDHDVDSLNEGIDAVQGVIRATYPSEHPDDDQGFDEMSAREAGYLVGVQVGLRLRAAAGDR